MSAVSTTSDVIGNLKGWYGQPFSTSMTAGGWFLFFGLILAISVGWGIILKDLRGDL